MNRRAPHSRARAFTLLELVLALAGSAILLAAVYGVFSRAVRLRDAATERIRETRVHARALAILSNDLRNGLVVGIALGGALEGSASGPGGSFPGYLKFTTTTARDIVRDAQEMPASDVQRVEYYIVTDPDAEDRKAGLLVRTATTELLATTQETPAEEALLPGVESMEVAFYSEGGWQESWEYSDNNKIVPEAVRVRLQPVAADGGVKPPIEVLVPWSTPPPP